jgi:hypothetical protein
MTLGFFARQLRWQSRPRDLTDCQHWPTSRAMSVDLGEHVRDPRAVGRHLRVGDALDDVEIIDLHGTRA